MGEHRTLNIQHPTSNVRKGLQPHAAGRAEVTDLRRASTRQAGLGINGGTSNIQHPTLNIECQKSMAPTGLYAFYAVSRVWRCGTTIPGTVSCCGAIDGAFDGTGFGVSAGAGDTGVCGRSGSFSFRSKAARAAAWAGLSAARAEMKPAPRRMHKPKTILVLMCWLCVLSFITRSLSSFPSSVKN